MPSENTHKEMCCCCFELTCGMRTLMVLYTLSLFTIGQEALNLFKYGYGFLGLAWLLHFPPIMFMSYWMCLNWCGKKDNSKSRIRIFQAFAAYAAVVTFIHTINVAVWYIEIGSIANEKMTDSELADFVQLTKTKIAADQQKQAKYVNMYSQLQAQDKEFIEMMQTTELSGNIARVVIFGIFNCYYTWVAYRWKNMVEPDSDSEENAGVITESGLQVVRVHETQPVNQVQQQQVYDMQRNQMEMQQMQANQIRMQMQGQIPQQYMGYGEPLSAYQGDINEIMQGQQLQQIPGMPSQPSGQQFAQYAPQGAPQYDPAAPTELRYSLYNPDANILPSQETFPVNPQDLTNSQNQTQLNKQNYT